MNGMARQNQLMDGAVSASTSNDLLGTHSGVDASGYASSEYAYGGVQAMDPGAARMYSNWDEADMGWQQQQRQQYYQHTPAAANQRVSYMPPSEPDASQAGDRYDSEYAARREEEAAAAAAAAGYGHYLPYHQQHYYDQQQLQHQAAADAGYYDNQGEYAGMHDGYYYEEPYATAEEQDRYLQSLRQGYGTEGGAGAAAVGMMDPRQQHHPGYDADAHMDRAGGAGENYGYDEGDVPYAKDETWSTPPPPQRALTVSSTHAGSQANAAATGAEVAEGATPAQRSSLQSSASTSSPQMRRSHSPQLIPSPRRAPQVLCPDHALGIDPALP